MKKRTLSCLCLTLLSFTFAGCSSNEEVYDLSLSERDQTLNDFDVGAERVPSARTLFTFAQILISQARDSEASFILGRIIREHAYFTPAYNELAEIHMRNNRIVDVVDIVSAGLKVAPLRRRNP